MRTLTTVNANVVSAVQTGCYREELCGVSVWLPAAVLRMLRASEELGGNADGLLQSRVMRGQRVAVLVGCASTAPSWRGAGQLC